MEDYDVINTQISNEPPLLYTRKLVADGRCEEALAVISREIDAFPDWAEPWAVMAQAFSRLSRFDEAVTAADTALALDPWHMQAQQLKAGLLLQLGFHDRALEAAQRLVALERNRPESHLFLAFAYTFKGMEIEAIEEARACKKLAPRRGFTHQALTVIHLAAKRWQLAESHAIAALQAEGPMASVYHDLAMALEQQGRHSSAREALAMAARLDARFELSLKRFNRRRLVPTRGIPALIAVAAGILLIPMSVSTVAFAGVAVVGAIALLVAALRTRSVSIKDVVLAH